MKKKIRPAVLLILDGFGLAQSNAGNAISLAKMEFYESLKEHFPFCALSASGEAVGLPKGEEGNSEVGHLNLGAGRIVYQDLPRINLSIADGSFFTNSAFLSAVKHTKIYNSSLHLIGLVGSGGVHSNIEHLFALLHLAKKNGIKKLFLHLFTDGRDSPPTSAPSYMSQIESEIKKNSIGKIVSIVGRYFAMDRDSHWDRTQKAYNLLTSGEGERAKEIRFAIEKAYNRGETDEFISPTALGKNENEIHESRIQDNDAVIFFNFRIDRPRQLTKMFVLPHFDKEAVSKSDYDPFTERYFKKMLIKQNENVIIPERKVNLTNLFFVTMTQYDRHLAAVPAFHLEKVANPIGQVLAVNKLNQLHLAESEKEKMVTYFFNGLRRDPFENEDRIIISSLQVATYDLAPQMSALEITHMLKSRFEYKKYDFTVINFANPDMLGHTGNINKTIEGLKTIDLCLKEIYDFVVTKMRGAIFITADHGNCEEMIDENGNIETSHSSNPVPFLAIAPDFVGKKMIDGVLADVAPTILNAMMIDKPEEMTGRNLL